MNALKNHISLNTAGCTDFYRGFCLHCNNISEEILDLNND